MGDGPNIVRYPDPDPLPDRLKVVLWLSANFDCAPSLCNGGLVQTPYLQSGKEKSREAKNSLRAPQ